MVTKTLCLFLACAITVQLLSAFSIWDSHVPTQARPGSSITYAIIRAAGNTYGYDIYSNKRMLIHQASIPGLPGNKGFRRKRDAEKTARLVIYKLQKNIMPPTVSRREMDSLSVKYF
jgi:cytochrome c5